MTQHTSESVSLSPCGRVGIIPVGSESNQCARRVSTRGHATMTEHEQQKRRLKLTELQLRIVKVALSIVATLLAIWQAF